MDTRADYVIHSITVHTSDVRFVSLEMSLLLKEVMAKLNVYNRFLTILSTFHFRNLAERNYVTVTGATHTKMCFSQVVLFGATLLRINRGMVTEQPGEKLKTFRKLA